MPIDYSEISDLVLNKIELVETEDGGHVIEDKESGRFFRVNSSTFEVLSLIQKGKSMTDVITDYNSCHHQSITPDNLDILFQRLNVLGLGNASDGIKRRRKKRSPIFFRIRILSKPTVAKISRYFCFLFHSRLFPVLFFCSVAFVVVFLLTQCHLLGNKSTSSVLTKLIYLFLLLFFQLFHEIGHASASMSLGVPAKAIGFGFFYGVIPVFYSDLTRAWTLPAKDRILVNLGGIYLDFLTSSLSIVLWMLFKWDFFLMYPYVIIGTTLRNLNIFLHYDGYWALSDMIRSDGLQAEANLAITKMIREQKLIQPENKSRSLFMIVYGLLSYSYLAVFIIILLVGYYKTIITFPSFIWSLIGSGSISEAIVLIEKRSWGAFLFPLLFYLIVIIKIYRFFQNKL